MEAAFAGLVVAGISVSAGEIERRASWRLLRCFFNVLGPFGVTKTSPIPPFPFLALYLRRVSDDKTVVDVPFREVVESLMWIATQTRPNIANSVRVIARFLLHPNEIQYEAACKIAGHLKATALLGNSYRLEDSVNIVMLTMLKR